MEDLGVRYPDGAMAECGVYGLTIVTPEYDLFYVGSAAGRGGFRRRWREHVSALRAGTHVNPRLQNSANIHQNYAFQILEVTYPADAAVQEQKYLDRLYGKPHVANACSTVHNPMYCPDARGRMRATKRAAHPDILITFGNGKSVRLPSQRAAAEALNVSRRTIPVIRPSSRTIPK